jgi:hypothetical protein
MMVGKEKEVLLELLDWLKDVLDKRKVDYSQAVEKINKMEKKLKEQDRWLES